jgi:hypothetical protein
MGRIKRGNQEMKNKKCLFFSADALIAAAIILVTILVLYPAIKSSVNKSEFSEDIIKVLSELKIGEIDNVYVKELIASGEITDLNKSIIQQIGEFYVKDTSKARALAEEIMSGVSTEENIGIWYGNDLIFSREKILYESAQNIEVESQFISGIRKGADVTGYSARAYLSKTKPSDYFYFGGYVGDGNISSNVSYEGEVNEIFLEIAINKEFDIYINGNFSGHYDKSPSEFIPAKYDLTSYKDRLHNGSNLIELKGNNLYIAGGYLKISYENGVVYSGPKKSYLPGIEGIINIYDGVYIPQNLSSMEVYLHYNSGNQTLFMNIGNKTVLSDKTSAEKSITLSDADLRSKINYNEIIGKNVPVRIGIQEVQGGGSGNADVILVTDFSGSMKKAINNDADQGSASINCDSLEEYPNARKTELAKCLDKIFVGNIFNNSMNRLWPVYFWGNVVSYYDNPTNPVAIKVDIDSHTQQGKDQTCLSCAINKGYDILKDNENASENRQKIIVLMTDGLPTHCGSGSCWSNSSIYGTKYCQGYCNFQGMGGACSYGGCNDSSCANPIQNAIYAASRAKEEQNIKIYTVGFGLVGNCEQAINLLQNIANITGGKFYKSSDVSELEEIYKNISQEILSLSYSGQISELKGKLYTVLYPDSYIKINSGFQTEGYGITTVSETVFSDNFHGSFIVPPNSGVVEARVVSYSGPRWTNEIFVNGISSYKLSNFGSIYIGLGDPYSIALPNSNIIPGSNIINLTTGVSPTNITYGSSYNKVILTTMKNVSSFSPIVSSANGCLWHIQFSDYSNSTLAVPEAYNGSSGCYYQQNREEYNNNDALQEATHNLLKVLDYNNDNLVDVKFSYQDLKISSFTVTGIPYMWETEVQVRRWY